MKEELNPNLNEIFSSGNDLTYVSCSFVYFVLFYIHFMLEALSFV